MTTVDNFVRLRAQLGALVIPVLQGWEIDDYRRCIELYEGAGVDLTAEPVVGLGSVCRRQATAEIGRIVDVVADAGIRCHGFGVKAAGIKAYGDRLASCDSMAWSYAGRRRGSCLRASRCAHCRHYAMSWRAAVLAAKPRPRQMEMAL